MAGINQYYEEELHHLRELAVEFAQVHPALAPMLSGQSPDPDVERLLEGVAFLVGLMRQRLADEFPEFLQGLGNQIFPHYLRPVPSCTFIAFRPGGPLKETVGVPRGTEVASVPVGDTSCVFQTCYDLKAHPLTIESLELLRHPESPAVLRMNLSLTGIGLMNWTPGSLRFFCDGPVSEGSRLYLLLCRYVDRIEITAPDAEMLVLSHEALRPAGFTSDEELLPYPSNSYSGYRLLQEYFVLPEKFLFVSLDGLERWQNRGDGNQFTVEFYLRKLPDWIPPITRESLVLNVVPAVNLFAEDAQPVTVDHRRSDYLVSPSDKPRENYQIFSIDEVTGYRQGEPQPRVHKPFGLFQQQANETSGTYQVTMRASPLVGRGFDAYLTLAYPPEVVPETEMLTVRLTCTNGSLPENLRPGDISRPTDSSPERLQFDNIRRPTPSLQPPSGHELLTRLLSHLALNYLSIANVKNFKALLELYVFADSQPADVRAAKLARVEAIEGLEVRPATRIVDGIPMRGQRILVRCRSDRFASNGDVFLFGAVLDSFFADYAAVNVFTQFEIEDVLTGERYQWPERVGQQLLL